MNTKRWIILLVEDEEDDVFFMKRALAKTQLDVVMQVVVNGQEAIDYLAGTGSYTDREVSPLPDCIFLDLKLPFVNGFDVLEWLRSQPSLANIPVNVLTSSPEERDRRRARELGARAYLVKPPTAPMLLEAMNLLTDSTEALEAHAAQVASGRQ